MKTKLLYLTLILSLGFNLFFVAGYLRESRRLQKTDPRQRQIELVSKRLSLSRSQEEQLRDILKHSRREILRLKERQKKTIRLFRREFDKTAPDIRRLKEAMTSVEQERKRAKNRLSKEWRTFFGSLTPRQKDKAKKMLIRHPELRRQLLLPSRP